MWFQSDFGEGQRGGALGGAGAVDEDVDLAEELKHRFAQGDERVAIFYVGGKAQRAASFGFDLRGGLLNFFAAAGGGDDVRARVGQAKREGMADASGATDDNGGLARKIKERFGQVRLQYFTTG